MDRDGYVADALQGGAKALRRYFSDALQGAGLNGVAQWQIDATTGSTGSIADVESWNGLVQQLSERGVQLSIARLKAKAAAARGGLWQWVGGELREEAAQDIVECVLPTLAKVVPAWDRADEAEARRELLARKQRARQRAVKQAAQEAATVRLLHAEELWSAADCKRQLAKYKLKGMRLAACERQVDAVVLGCGIAGARAVQKASGFCEVCGFDSGKSRNRREHMGCHVVAALGMLERAGGKPAGPPLPAAPVHMPPVLAASEGAEEAALQPVRAELELAVRELAPRYSAALSPILPPGQEPPPFTAQALSGKIIEYTMAMVDEAGKCVEKYRYVHFAFPFHPLPLCVAQCSNLPLFFHAGMWAGCCACLALSAGAWGGGMWLWHACWRGGRKRWTLTEIFLSTHRKRRSWCCGRRTTARATSATSGWSMTGRRKQK